MTQDINERVGILENQIKTHDKRIQKVEDKNDAITRLTILYENQEQKNEERERRQDERDRKQQEQLDKFADTIEKVNDNLTSLNTTQQHLQSEVGQIGDRVEEIEKKADEKKIDPSKVFKEIIYKVIPSFILAYLLFKFGLK